MTQTTSWPAFEVERRATNLLVPYPNNARTHSDDQVASIVASIREWGWTTPILVDEAGGIIAGHARHLAAKSLGADEVPVVVARGWSEAQKRAYVLADNQLTLNAGWDENLLKIEIGALGDDGFDLGLLGFPDGFLAGLLDDREGLTDPDETPPLPVEPVTQPGDLWICGRHRILCGDSRDPDHVARLTGDRPVNLAFTSPPYAEQRDYDPASGFQPVPPDEYVAWFEPVAMNVARHLAADGSWFINIKPASAGLDTELYVFDLVLAHVRRWGWHFATEFCWQRNGVPKGVTQRFKNQFEPVYQFAQGRWKMRPDAVRHESDDVPTAGGRGSGQTTWKHAQGQFRGIVNSFGAAKKRKHGTTELMSDHQGYSAAPGEYIGPGLAYPGNRLPTFTASHEATGHAAAFPAGLPEFFCKAYTDAGDVVFDPFLGSGSTLIAAEMAGRDGLGMEISPAYCDVAVERWQAFTGEKAQRE